MASTAGGGPGATRKLREAHLSLARPTWPAPACAPGHPPWPLLPSAPEPLPRTTHPLLLRPPPQRFPAWRAGSEKGCILHRIPRRQPGCGALVCARSRLPARGGSRGALQTLGPRPARIPRGARATSIPLAPAQRQRAPAALLTSAGRGPAHLGGASTPPNPTLHALPGVLTVPGPGRRSAYHAMEAASSSLPLHSSALGPAPAVERRPPAVTYSLQWLRLAGWSGPPTEVTAAGARGGVERAEQEGRGTGPRLPQGGGRELETGGVRGEAGAGPRMATPLHSQGAIAQEPTARGTDQRRPRVFR